MENRVGTGLRIGSETRAFRHFDKLNAGKLASSGSAQANERVSVALGMTGQPIIMPAGLPNMQYDTDKVESTIGVRHAAAENIPEKPEEAQTAFIPTPFSWNRGSAASAIVRPSDDRYGVVAETIRRKVRDVSGADLPILDHGAAAKNAPEAPYPSGQPEQQQGGPSGSTATAIPRRTTTFPAPAAIFSTRFTIPGANGRKRRRPLRQRFVRCRNRRRPAARALRFGIDPCLSVPCSMSSMDRMRAATPESPKTPDLGRRDGGSRR